jgi:c-di-GMP-binding flagellar brake protein YcgR
MDLQEIMRKYFRISVKGDNDVSMRINEARYDVIDVGDSGIGIRLTPEDIFIAAEDELPIELKIKGVIHNMRGKVVHITPSGPEEFLCGIEFINIDKESKNKLMEYLQGSREKIFRGE